MNRRDRRRLEQKYYSHELTRRDVLTGEPCTISQQWNSMYRAAEVRESLHRQGLIDIEGMDGDAIAAEIRRYYNDGK